MMEGHGSIPHDVPDAGNPLKVGVHARTGAPTAVGNDDRADVNADEFGSVRVVITDPATGAEFGTGAVPVQGAGAAGVASVGNPVLVAGRDATNNTTNVRTDGSGFLMVVGDLAHDAVDSGNPQKIGGKARAALPAAVAAADRVDAMFDVYGRLVVVPYVAGASEVKSLLHDLVTISTTRQTVVTPTAGKKIRIVGYSINNLHASTNFSVEIYFGTGANIETTKANAIARHSVVATGSSTQEGHFPDGGGPVGAADAVLSTRSNTDAASNVQIIVHYREE